MSLRVADYVFLVDVDFVPSANLPAIIQAHAAALMPIATPADLPKTRVALVVPALSMGRFSIAVSAHASSVP